MKKKLTNIQAWLAHNKHARKTKMPSAIQPMLAVLTHDYFYSTDWIYERKLDGERCLAFKKNRNVTLKTRNDSIISNNYPEVKHALEKNDTLESAIFDGEIVAFKGNVTSFSRLQPRMLSTKNTHSYPVYYYIFDILYLNGYDLTALPLIERKRLLKTLFTYTKPLRYCNYTISSSPAKFREICKRKWEGFIVKNAQSTYVHKRSPAWLKFKCSEGQEMVIGGFTDPRGSRTGFGALLLGYYKQGKLQYAGKVGTGFSEETLHALRTKFDRITTSIYF